MISFGYKKKEIYSITKEQTTNRDSKRNVLVEANQKSFSE